MRAARFTPVVRFGTSALAGPARGWPLADERTAIDPKPSAGVVWGPHGTDCRSLSQTGDRLARSDATLHAPCGGL